MSLPGRQVVPLRKSSRPISRKVGMALPKRNTQIRMTQMIDTQAATANTPCISPSRRRARKPLSPPVASISWVFLLIYMLLARAESRPAL